MRGQKGIEWGVRECDIVIMLEVDEVSPSLPVLWPAVVQHQVKGVSSQQI